MLEQEPSQWSFLTLIESTPVWLVLLFFLSIGGLFFIWYSNGARRKNQLLLTSLQHINQGIAVIDKDLRIREWNQQYVDLFDLPDGYIHEGIGLADVMRYNAKFSVADHSELEMQVQRRIAYYEQGLPHISSRNRPTGEIIEVQANPLPDGGFVVTCSDVTDFRRTEQALKEANETLEDRVTMRTKSLEHLNIELFEANKNAESVLRSKNRLLAAVSHDLMQPLNAARLFSSSLSETAGDKQTRTLSKHIETALGAAEDLISDLLDVSRLEAGTVSADICTFAINNVLDNLKAEFQALAKQQGINFKLVSSSVMIKSDPRLLRRILQNLLTNAFRYSQKDGQTAHVSVGVRRIGDKVRVEVWDNGIGIPIDKQDEIFEEFTRVDPNRADQGLGLGLSISCGFARLLDHEVTLRSWFGKGSVFSVTIERSEGEAIEPIDELLPKTISLIDLNVLCVDNDPDIILGMEVLLKKWGCQVRSALNLEQSLQQVNQDWTPHVVLSDYHLDNGETGIDVLLALEEKIPHHWDGILISADRSSGLFETAHQHGFHWLTKPVKALKLRTLLNQILQEVLERNQ